MTAPDRLQAIKGMSRLNLKNSIITSLLTGDYYWDCLISDDLRLFFALLTDFSLDLDCELLSILYLTLVITSCGLLTGDV